MAHGVHVCEQLSFCIDGLNGFTMGNAAFEVTSVCACVRVCVCVCACACVRVCMCA